MDKIRKGYKMEELFQVRGSILTIRIPDELDHHSAETIREGSERILENQGIREVIFDFRDTQFMDSSGIGMLMGRYRSMNQMGGTVKAVHVKERVAKILQLSGIFKVIPIELEKSWGDV
ncbi:MAG TPA: anti-sigma factor antagonist [Candidatus Pelethocola excrementipullorum]|nr:anti-sigma factor antagonist [Candidatus Pelethocola excrementipullorum]